MYYIYISRGKANALNLPWRPSHQKLVTWQAADHHPLAIAWNHHLPQREAGGSPPVTVVNAAFVGEEWGILRLESMAIHGETRGFHFKPWNPLVLSLICSDRPTHVGCFVCGDDDDDHHRLKNGTGWKLLTSKNRMADYVDAAASQSPSSFAHQIRWQLSTTNRLRFVSWTRIWTCTTSDDSDSKK
jgi:hypothetical protein